MIITVPVSNPPSGVRRDVRFPILYTRRLPPTRIIEVNLSVMYGHDNYLIISDLIIRGLRLKIKFIFVLSLL